jgi:hypothetical protein
MKASFSIETEFTQTSPVLIQVEFGTDYRHQMVQFLKNSAQCCLRIIAILICDYM